MSIPTVAIIGRPNVGKSTLFNRIIGRRQAIVDAQPGVTRDRHFAPAEWNGRRFWLVDTGGLVPGSNDPINRAIRTQVEQAVADSDALLFVVDIEAGIHPMDLEIALYLRKVKRPLILVVNKADDLPDETRQLSFYELGLGDPCPVSAAVGKSSGDLLDKLVTLLPQAADVEEEETIDVAVVGRPNVGKSSLVNRLLGQERLVVADEPGTTRAMERADVCVLVVDAKDGMHAQDLKIANEAWDRGAGVLIAVNKWDLIEEKVTNTARDGERDIKARAPFLEFIPFFYVSAKTGQRVNKLFDAIVTVAEEREKRVPTAEVNRVLEELLARQQPPQPVGESVRLFYATQTGTAPPRFAVIANRPEAIPESYTRYLHNGFREAWEFTGAPLTIKFRRKRGRR